jgi:von Willebrand factor/von Willebrand factor type A domain
MAAKGADQGSSQIAQLGHPIDGLGAVSGSSNSMSNNIGGGKTGPPVAAPADPTVFTNDKGTTPSSNFKFTGRAQVAQGAPVPAVTEVVPAPHAAAPSGITAAEVQRSRDQLSGLLTSSNRSEQGRSVVDTRRHANTIPHRAEPYPTQVEQNRDQHAGFNDNAIKQVDAEPVSTFSLDVDTASYDFGRRVLNAGRLPQPNAVRVEEMINYFPYAYPVPESADAPFAPVVSIFPAPWNAANKLVHIGIKGYTLRSAERPHANLVFLIDVSGSMSPEDRLPLVKNAFRLLLDQLRPDDAVGIVTYASGSGVAHSPTRAANRAEILAAIARLGAGCSTAGAQGINDAYALAVANFDNNGVDRIILATDGDFNVGITDRDELKSFVERKPTKVFSFRSWASALATTTTR